MARSEEDDDMGGLWLGCEKMVGDIACPYWVHGSVLGCMLQEKTETVKIHFFFVQTIGFES